MCVCDIMFRTSATTVSTATIDTTTIKHMIDYMMILCVSCIIHFMMRAMLIVSEYYASA